MLLGLLFENPIVFFLIAASLVLCLTIHEYAHAFTADYFGDDTPRYLGRLTLNPLAHLDPLGTLLLLIAGFGWGKPVPVNPTNFRNSSRDMAIVAFAGPLSNFILAIIFSQILRIFPSTQIANTFFYLVVMYNLLLGFFNLIPVFPLDGYNIISGLLPLNLRFQWTQVAAYGPIILLILIVTRTTSRLLMPLIDFSLSLLGLR